MRFRFLPLCLIAFASVFFVAGCSRYEASPFTAEIDESNYRRGKDLLRQGRNQEALACFLKVVEKRGDDAPESHLEIGILYQQHIKDPVAAIYHYRKFRELKPNSPQADLVRQRIDAATREFARTLPAQPLENQMERVDLLDRIDQLQKENNQLKDQLVGVKTIAVNTPRSSSPAASSNLSPSSSVNVDDGSPSAGSSGDSPISALPDTAAPMVDSPVTPAVVATFPPTRPGAQTATPPVTLRPGASSSTTQTPATSGGRRHVVAKGDTLFSIAQRYYGNKSRWREIQAANRATLPSESTPLRIGMELKIP